MALGSILLLGIVFAAYSPALRGTFLWDDHGHVPDRSGFYTLSGLSQIWRQPGYTQQYYPLTFTTVWLAHHLWGVHPLGYHALTVLFHGFNAILLFLLLDGLGCPGSWWGALLFALHPVEVESVAWISEIKNTQSTLFYLSALTLYLRSSDRGGWKTYLLAFAIYLGALASKTVACTWPAVVLVLVWYRNGRVCRKEFFRLSPFFGVGVLMALVTAGFEEKILGAIGPAWEFTGLERICLAGRAFWFYIGKLFRPYPLIFNYPLWDVHRVGPADAFRVLAVMMSYGVLWKGRRRWGNGPFAAFAIFGIGLSPALGFVNFYPMRYSFVADHFQYQAGISLMALAAAGVCRLLRGGSNRLLPPAVFGLLAAGLGGMTWHYAHAYRDPEALYKDVLSKNPASMMALESLAAYLVENNRIAEARAYLREAEQLHPQDIYAQTALAHLRILCDQDYQGAIPSFERASREIGRFPVMHSTQMAAYYFHAVLAEAYFQTRRYPEAKAELQDLLLLLPPLTARAYYDTSPSAMTAASRRIHDRLATVLALEGNFKAANAHRQWVLDHMTDGVRR